MNEHSHLHRYGYAPGNYQSSCGQCGGQMYDVDKRASCCRSCAEILHWRFENEFDVLGVVESACSKIGHTEKDLNNIFVAMSEEVGELATEILIVNGLKNRESVEGIVGEAVDVMICAMDIIFAHTGSLNNDTVKRIVDTKLNKWVSKYGQPTE